MSAPRAFIPVLNFSSWGARLILALFIVVHTVLAISVLAPTPVTWPGVGSLLLICAAAVVSIQNASRGLRHRSAGIIVASVAVSTAIMSLQLPLGGDVAGSAWHLGANTFLLMMLALRGRTGAAWLGFTIMGAITIDWFAWSGPGAADAVELLLRHAATLFIGSLIAVMLRGTENRIARFHEIEQRQATDEAVARASLDERRTRIARLEAIARPMLERIGSGQHLTETEREECRVIEATLRDSVRARLLSTASLDAAVIDARRRGVAVTLLDDRATPLSNFDGERMSEWVTNKLESTSTGSAVVRLLPAGRASLATVVVENGAEAAVHHLTTDPTPG